MGTKKNPDHLANFHLNDLNFSMIFGLQCYMKDLYISIFNSLVTCINSQLIQYYVMCFEMPNFNNDKFRILFHKQFRVPNGESS